MQNGPGFVQATVMEFSVQSPRPRDRESRLAGMESISQQLPRSCSFHSRHRPGRVVLAPLTDAAAPAKGLTRAG